MTEQIEKLVEWELDSMNYSALQEFFINNMIKFYTDNPKAYKDMLSSYNEYMDTEIVLQEECVRND
jgi:hypothetical protein